MHKVLMRWQAGSLSGWGVLGLNLFEHWAADPDLQPLMGVRLDVREFRVPARSVRDHAAGSRLIQQIPR